MLNGRYTTLIISVIAHILLVVALVLLSDKQQIKAKKIIKKEEIKSYLYRPKKNKSVKKQVVKANIIPITQPNVAIKDKVPAVKKVEPEIPPEKTENKTEIKPSKEITIEELSLPTKPQEKQPSIQKKVDPQLPEPVISAKEKRSHALHNSLSRLRNSINQQLVDDTFKQHTQVRSASEMHGAQIPVPHSNVELTSEAKHKKNTQSNHAQSITKNDNGTCTIVREQMLGSPVEASVSGFACGENKFDKSFREHMEEVNKKFVTYKK